MKKILFVLICLSVSACENINTPQPEEIDLVAIQNFIPQGTFAVSIVADRGDNQGWAVHEEYDSELRIRQLDRYIQVHNSNLKIQPDGEVIFAGSEGSTNIYTDTTEWVTYSGGIDTWAPLTFTLNFDYGLESWEGNFIYTHYDYYKIVVGEKLYNNIYY